MPVNLITGTDDDDSILGTRARDLIHAGLGNDRITTMGGHDTVYGDGGNDTIFAYFGDDVLYGGDGDDLLVTSGTESPDIGLIHGGAGNDRIYAGDRIGHSYGGAGDDIVTVNFVEGGEAHGGSGTDRLAINLYWAPSDLRVIAIASGSDAGVRVGADYLRVTGFEALQITTRDADDYVRGGALDDRIALGRGANIALGLAGDDLIAYHSGAANFLDGGAGADTLQVTQPSLDGSLWFEVSGTSATDNHGSRLTGFESWVVVGGNQGDLVFLGDGDDHFSGRAGRDVGLGYGGADRLLGNGGADQLVGGAGDDFLAGGAGIDWLVGGGGADDFCFGTLDQAGDLILDFAAGSDRIVIRARALDRALTDGPLDDASFALGNALGTGAQFVYRLDASQTTGALYWDADGSSAGAEVLIARLSGAPDLAAFDILIL